MLVEVKVVGARTGVEPRELADAPNATLPLRALIEHVVRAEVAAYNDRDRDRRLLRALTPAEIAAGVARGKVEAGGRQTTGTADADAAVEEALLAFTDGLYFLFVDDQQREDLDEPVAVTSDTRLRFLRLTPLAGG